jgi:hypothetical protein
MKKMKKNVKVMKVLKYVPNFSLQEWKCSKVECCICYWQDMCSCAALLCCFKHYLLTITMTMECLCDRVQDQLVWGSQ